MPEKTAQYWDTKGVVNMAALANGRIGLKFSGEDGRKRVLTIPASHIVPLILSLIDFASKIAETHDIGDSVRDVQRLAVESIGIGAAVDGSEFSLVLKTVDRLEAHFGFPAATAEALAAGLIEELARHGRQPANLKSDGPKH